MKKVLGDKNKKINNKTEKEISFVVTFHPRLKILQKIIHKKLYLLCMNEETKRAFTPTSMISYKSSRKFCIHLVRAKSYPINRTVGCYKCGSNRCEVCKYLTDTGTYTKLSQGRPLR